MIKPNKPKILTLNAVVAENGKGIKYVLRAQGLSKTDQFFILSKVLSLILNDKQPRFRIASSK